jgi:hypothetical protein
MAAKVDELEVRRVKRAISRNSRFALHALRTIYARCTLREQIAGRDLGERDGRGFTPFEMGRMIGLHDRLAARGWAATPDELDEVRGRMQKYAAQVIAASREARTEGRRGA